VEEKVRDIKASLAEQLRKITNIFKQMTQTTKGKNGLKKRTEERLRSVKLLEMQATWRKL